MKTTAKPLYQQLRETYSESDEPQFTKDVARLNYRDLAEHNLHYLAEALEEFLKVINRSPAALHHYGEAIKKGEQALSRIS